jgi:hypothetical protein
LTYTLEDKKEDCTVYTKVKENDVPKRGRKSESRFEKTPEWAAMRKDLARGLKAKEALQVVLTEEDKLKYNLQNRRTVARFIKKYLEENGLDYRVDSFQRDGVDYIVVRTSV